MARPSFFTVEEAARVLRIGRTAAYQAAKQYRETGGTEGLKVIQVGGSLRVPGAWLEEVADGPVDIVEPVPVRSLDDVPEPSLARSPALKRRGTPPTPTISTTTQPPQGIA